MTKKETQMYEQRRTLFGTLAEDYDASRPDWSAPTADWLVGTNGATGRLVLDLGAGTGKLTSTLVRAGHLVLAMDPSAREC